MSFGWPWMFTAPAEYRNREIYVDLRADNRDQLLKLVTSETVLIEFGPKQERISIYQNDRTPDGGNLDGFIGDLAAYVSKSIGGGPVSRCDSIWTFAPSSREQASIRWPLGPAHLIVGGSASDQSSVSSPQVTLDLPTILFEIGVALRGGTEIE